MTCSLGTLLNGATATITIRGTVSPGSALSNTGTITINEVDAVSSNNASTVVVAISGPANIPTLDPFALMMLALILGLAGVVAMKRG